MTAICLDCEKPLPAVMSDAYPDDAQMSRCYLCPFCRTHRYTSEAAAMSRCRAGLAKRYPEHYAVPLPTVPD